MKTVIYDKATRKLYQAPESVIRGRRVSVHVSRAFLRCKNEMDAWLGTFASFASSGQFNCYPVGGSEGSELWAIQLDKDYGCILVVTDEGAGREEVWILRLEHVQDIGAAH